MPGRHGAAKLSAETSKIMLTTRPSKVRWRLLFCLFALSAVTYLDRVNISISGRRIAGEFHFNDVQLGWIFSSFVLGYALFQVPGGWLADRFGARRVLTGGAIWWALFTAATAAVYAKTRIALGLFLVVRFVLGAGEAVVYPSSNRFVANWIPSGERGIANGLIFAGVGAGAGVAPLLITAVMMHFGWRMSFWLCAVLGAVAGLVWLLLARDHPEEHAGANQAEIEAIRSGLPTPPESGSSVPWAAVFTSRDVIAGSFSYFCYGYAVYIFFTWFFIYLNEVRGVNLRVSAFYTMLPFIAMVVGSPSGGLLADAATRRWGKRLGRCGIAALGMWMGAIFIALGAGVKHPGLSTAVLAGGVFALFLAQSSFWALTADIAGPSAGAVSGLLNLCCQVGGAVTASLTPVIATRFGWTASFLTAAGLCALGAAAWLLVDPNRVLPCKPGINSYGSA
jgi:MFS transporter, ACS family, glucarate transporter